MHLTNYSINKHSETYEKGESVSSGINNTKNIFWKINGVR